ncbi:A24 family peptidase [Variovorax sp. CAN2819]|uniref:A24 family peptidase n=1 Tax=Variovorax sp. CAN15 TaxID=3046727 RepID=UPI002648A76F|nr:A24 family peptidase [Variovorax sp. CAN15]MDN6884911.1 A24 family peptidase [Variovorax sp. CAN15]
MPALTCLLWLLCVAVYDFRKRRVPNWLVLSGAVLALAILCFGAQPFGVRWTAALAGAVSGFAFLLLFYAMGLMGAGDVKFAGALGLWVGMSALVPIWIIASLFAGLHGVLWLALRRWPFFPRLALILSGPPSPSALGGTSPSRDRFIPYGAYLALATVIWMFWGRQS